MAKQLLFALLVLGLASLACAQYRPHLDADVQTKAHPAYKKEHNKYKKDDYDSDEAEEPYYGGKKDYYKSPPPTPSPPPPSPPPPKDYDYSYHHKYGGSSDYYKPSPPPASPPPPKDYDYPHTGYKSGPGYDHKPSTPGSGYKPGYGYKPATPGYDYKPGDSMPPPYYPSDDYGYDGHHPKDVHFTLSEGGITTNNDGVLATTSIRRAILSGTENGMAVPVGQVAWTGTVWQINPNRLNWLLTFNIEQEEWEGKIIAAGPSTTQFDPVTKEFPIIGGSGMYEGVTGTVTWKAGTSNAVPVPGIYTFDITLWPHKKRHSRPEYAAAYTASSQAESYDLRW